MPSMPADSAESRRPERLEQLGTSPVLGDADAPVDDIDDRPSGFLADHDRDVTLPAEYFNAFDTRFVSMVSTLSGSART